MTWDGNDPYAANSANPSSLGTPTSPGNFANTANDLRRVQRSGLGTQDLTNSGQFNSLAIEVLMADLGLDIQMTVYDTNGTGISTATYNISSAGISEPTIIYFPFDALAASLLPAARPRAIFSGNARFTNVGAINLTLKATRTDVDAQIELLRPANTQETIPEPSVSLFTFLGVAGFAWLSHNHARFTKK